MLRKLLSLVKAVGLLLTLVALTSCGQIPLNVGFLNPSSTLELAIASIAPASRPGTYNLTGRTNLPDETDITVSAIRILQPNNAFSSNTQPTYAILARQTAQVKQRNWQTTLNLWQIAPDGRFQESWQLAESQAGTLQPAADVIFVATLDPTNLSDQLKRQLEVDNKRFEGNLVRFTTDGEAFLQASQTVAMELPTGRTNPPAPRQEEISAVRSSRPTSATASTPATAPAKFDITNAPLSADEFLR